MWEIAGKSVVGTSHQANSLPCQDAWDFRRTEQNGQRIFIALADGAGFASQAEAAARLAVEAALDAMSAYVGPLEDLGERELGKWLEHVRQIVKAAADKSDVSIKEYSATLLGAIIEGTHGYFWQLGDGAWIVKNASGIEIATWPCSGEYINQTVFITSEEALVKWTHAYVKDLTALLGITDGLEHICLDYPNKVAFQPFLAKVFSALKAGSSVDIEENIEGLLSSPLINNRTDDDKTMVLAWNRLELQDANGRSEQAD